MIEETIIHPETGEVLHRDVRPVEFKYKGESVVMNMPGWYPAKGDDGIFSMEDMAVHDRALRIMKARRQQHLEEQGRELGNVALA